MGRRVIDENEVMTALCLWEAWLVFETIGFTKKEKGEEPGETCTVLEELRGNHGSFVCRQLMIDLAPDCDKVWEALSALLGDGDPPCWCWDFEFVPEFLAQSAANGLLDKLLDRQYGGQPGPYSGVIQAA
jgi:hypothetical protein